MSDRVMKARVAKMVPRCLFAVSLILAIAIPAQVLGDQAADAVLVVKSERRLYLLRENEAIASYPVTFGSNPQGHKAREGDERTPEGRYELDWKNAHSAFYKAIHVSYPNASDRAEAAANNEDPGGAIMIHGQKNGYGWLSPLSRFFNWTDGCIALSDSDMEEVWQKVEAGTPIEIRP